MAVNHQNLFFYQGLASPNKVRKFPFNDCIETQRTREPSKPESDALAIVTRREHFMRVRSLQANNNRSRDMLLSDEPSRLVFPYVWLCPASDDRKTLEVSR